MPFVSLVRVESCVCHNQKKKQYIEFIGILYLFVFEWTVGLSEVDTNTKRKTEVNTCKFKLNLCSLFNSNCDCVCLAYL